MQERWKITQTRGVSCYFGEQVESKKLKIYMFCFVFEGDGREKGRETWVQERNVHQLPCAHTTMGQSRNPGKCPDREPNRRPFSLCDTTQPTEPHRPGRRCTFSTQFQSEIQLAWTLAEVPKGMYTVIQRGSVR